MTQSAMHVLDNGGAVRGFRYWGTRTLPQRMRRQKQFFNYGECVPPILDLKFLSTKGLTQLRQLLVHALRRVPKNTKRLTRTLKKGSPRRALDDA